ncbi:MAG: 6-bladed beta-propeller [Anaerosomatales bacterium]|nr:6-bladed beta-propeller [Anaerosomatales bacterium]MDT8434827.1 6-bladed beta-propeller [Anaerosomatales bacterium]
MTGDTKGATVDTPEAGAADMRGGLAASRGTLARLGTVLLATLIGLVVFLVFYLTSSGGYVTRGAEVMDGLAPVLAINGPGHGGIPDFHRPMGAAFGRDGRIYVSDTENNRIAVFSQRGRFLFDFGGFGFTKPLPGVDATWEEGLLNSPLGIDVDENGDVYVADFRNDQIQVFDAQGNFLRRFPDPHEIVGRGASGQDGTGIAVTDVALWGDFVYALDSYQIVVFTKAGQFVRQFGRPGSGPGEFEHPNGIDIMPDSTVVVADSNNGRVQALTLDGVFLWETGVRGGTEYEFGLPRGVAAVDDGTIVVVDAFEHNIVLLDAAGNVIGSHGMRGVAPAQLNFPNGVDTADDLLLVTDKENDRIQVLRINP